MFYLFCFLDSHRTQHEWSCHQLSQKFANPLLALVLTKKQSLVSFLHILDSSAQFFSMWTHGGHNPLTNTDNALVSEHFTGQKKVPCVAVCMRLLQCFSCGAVFNFEIPQLLNTHLCCILYSLMQSHQQRALRAHLWNILHLLSFYQQITQQSFIFSFSEAMLLSQKN